MIIFNHNNGDLKQAIFSGTIDDLCADLCLEISQIYGAMKRKDSGLAEHFRESIMMLLVNRGLQDEVFDTEVFDAISGSGAYESGTITINKEEFEKQLKELLSDEGE